MPWFPLPLHFHGFRLSALVSQTCYVKPCSTCITFHETLFSMSQDTSVSNSRKLNQAHVNKTKRNWRWDDCREPQDHQKWSCLLGNCTQGFERCYTPSLYNVFIPLQLSDLFYQNSFSTKQEDLTVWYTLGCYFKIELQRITKKSMITVGSQL